MFGYLRSYWIVCIWCCWVCVFVFCVFNCCVCCFYLMFVVCFDCLVCVFDLIVILFVFFVLYTFLLRLLDFVVTLLLILLLWSGGFDFGWMLRPVCDVYCLGVNFILVCLVLLFFIWSMILTVVCFAELFCCSLRDVVVWVFRLFVV